MAPQINRNILVEAMRIPANGDLLTHLARSDFHRPLFILLLCLRDYYESDDMHAVVDFCINELEEHLELLNYSAEVFQAVSTMNLSGSKRNLLSNFFRLNKQLNPLIGSLRSLIKELRTRSKDKEDIEQSVLDTKYQEIRKYWLELGFNDSVIASLQALLVNTSSREWAVRVTLSRES